VVATGDYRRTVYRNGTWGSASADKILARVWSSSVQIVSTMAIFDVSLMLFRIPTSYAYIRAGADTYSGKQMRPEKVGAARSVRPSGPVAATILFADYVLPV
jgi:hypothetical protein